MQTVYPGPSPLPSLALLSSFARRYPEAAGTWPGPCESSPRTRSTPQLTACPPLAS